MKKRLLALITGLFALSLSAQTFTASVTQGCAPLAVTFTPNVPGAVGYQWSLGNSVNSVIQTPGTVYNTGGSYTVTLVATFPNGSTTTISKPAFIQVFNPPVAQFSASPLQVCAGVPVAFVNSSTAGSSPIVGQTWDFGDGNTSLLLSQPHAWQLDGQYTVSLSVQDANGCVSIEEKKQYITVNPSPDPGFSVSNALFCNSPAVVNFTSNTQTAGFTHSWTFGNSTNSTLVSPSIVYPNNGVYTVTHIVTDPIGCSDTLTQAGLINVGVPTVTLQATPAQVCAGGAIAFGAALPPGGSIVWQFPGGGSSTAAAPVQVFNTAGTFTVTANVTIAGCVVPGNVQVTIHPKPNVNFAVNPSLICNPPYTATFTNLTTGATSYNWNLNVPTSPFGSPPAGSTAANPVYTYTQAGTYNVQLTATSPFGCTNTLSQPSLLEVGPTVAGALGVPRQGCAPLSVNFSDASSSPSTINSWNWNFGDGGTSTLQNPTHIYVNPGTYTVTLIIGTVHGCKDTLVWPAMVKAGVKPIADFIADTTLTCASSPVQFTNTTIPAPDSSFWDFGDLDYLAAIHPSHFFLDTGYMDITLIALDRGCPDTIVKPMMLYVKGPIGIFSPNDEKSCVVPTVQSFLDASIDPQRWHWDFGTGILSDTSNLQNPTFTYTAEGVYPVTLKVFNDSNGCDFTIGGTVQIKRVDAIFTPSVLSGCAPLPVTFTDQSLNPYQWFWEFSNGDYSNVQSPQYTFSTPGSYNVKVTVINSLNCIDTQTTQIKVYKPLVNFTITDTTNCAPYVPAFNNLTTSLAPVTQWQWSFAAGGTSTAQTPVQSFNGGTYTISLTVTDSAGCVTTKTKPNYLYVANPLANFSVAHPINCPGNAIPFINSSSGVQLGYQWSFSDGSTSTLFAPTKSFPTGIYDATLIITDNIGCKDTLARPAYLNISPPVVNFTGSPTFAPCPPLAAAFTFQAVSPHPFSTYQWTFGTGGASVLQNPSHVYTWPGNYDVRLIATAPSGCKDTMLKTTYISVGGPTGTFSFSPAVVCPNEPFTLTGVSATAVKFEWDMKDGNLLQGNPINHQYPLPGTYDPQMLITDANGCTVTAPAIGSVTVKQAPNAAFTLSTTDICDAGNVTFTSTSTPAASITGILWQFTNGGTSTSNLVTRTYTQTGTYGATLIVTNDVGCKDTLKNLTPIIVGRSPETAIVADTIAGCVTFQPQLSHQTTIFTPPGTVEWFMVGGSGQTPLPDPPALTLSAAGTYTVKLRVVDSLGCADSALVSLTAHPLPEPDFFLPQPLGCAPFVAAFNNLTPNSAGYTYEWNLGDSTTSTDPAPTHTYSASGEYAVSLIAITPFGCRDTLIKDPYVRLSNPVADFSATPLVICPGNTVSFTGSATGQSAINKYVWSFGDGSTLFGTSTTTAPSHTYTTAGSYDVELEATDVLGCVGVARKLQYIRVRPDVEPPRPAVVRATVAGDSLIRIEWTPYGGNIDEFGGYRLFRVLPSGADSLIFATVEPTASAFEDTSVVARISSGCYRLESYNACGRSSQRSVVHCSIEARADAMPDVNMLSWTPYTGWPVTAYQVYRTSGYGTAGTLVGEVPGTTTDFADTTLYCNTPVSYRIVALGGSAPAFSDTTRTKAIHSGPALPADMLNATIEENAYASLLWQLPAVRMPKRVILSRSEGKNQPAATRQWEMANLPALPLTDADNIQPTEAYYTYQLQVEDICGDKTPVGLPANTLLLRAVKTGTSQATLKWNPYLNWAGGVQRYEVDFYDEKSQTFELLAILPDTAREMVDSVSNKDQMHKCYRVRAIGNNETVQRSLSNEDCVELESSFWMPNAFTPNGDTANATFYFPGEYQENATLQVFDRWGHKIVTVSGKKPEWDGKDATGKELQEGVYLCVFDGLGQDKRAVHLSTWIVLIR